ncbi:MAG: hypothetical protein ACOC2W_04705, partial [bacterium]
MSNENNILIDNIKTFRALNEDVSGNDIVDAIQNHEYIYIYYTGDESNARGYRTVRPYVIGTTKAGNKVLRAWQDKGKSDSYDGKTNRRRPDHEYWSDHDGKVVPGWRLFRVDRIGSVYPTGKKFNDSNGAVLIPPKYREGADDQMGGGIIAYVTKSPQKMAASNIDNVAKRSVVKRKVSDFDTQAKKWQDFYDANQAERNITAQDVQKLYDIVRKVYKKSPSNYVVFINDKNNLDLKYFKDKDEIPEKLQLGRLTNLYDRFVKKSDDAESE